MDEMYRFLTEHIPGKSPDLQARNQAIFEVLYATGIRLAELISLDLDDFDRDHEYLSVVGKGSKERIVPLGQYARESVESYCRSHRPPHLAGPEERAFLLTPRRAPLGKGGRAVHPKMLLPPSADP